MTYGGIHTASPACMGYLQAGKGVNPYQNFGGIDMSYVRKPERTALPVKAQYTNLAVCSKPFMARKMQVSHARQWSAPILSSVGIAIFQADSYIAKKLDGTYHLSASL